MKKKNDLNIKPLDLKIVPTALEKSKKVMVSCEINGKISHYYIFINKKEGYKDEDYIREARKQLNADIKNGVIKKKVTSTTFKHPFVLATLGVVGAIALTMTGLFTWKAITATGGGGDVPPGPEPDPSNYVTLTLDAGEGNTVEGTKNQKFKYYVEKGATVADTFKTLNYKGAVSEDNDFLYWTIKSQPIDMEYVINEDINLVPAYKPTATDCLTITARQDNLSINFAPGKNLQVSFDRKDWDDVTSDAIVLEHAGDQVYIKREVETALNSKIISSSNKLHSVSGPIETLVGGKTSGLESSTFAECFSEDSNLISANNLNLGNIALVDYCYYKMFQYCTSLTTAPSLPAKTIPYYGYALMFDGCKSLIAAPELPAETLGSDGGCYYFMFQNCTSLITAPKVLPATELTFQCYYYMFNGCSSLITAPEIHAEKLAENCCNSMFQNCTSLIAAPELPATTLATGCYQNMFYNCTSLITAPKVLPATTLMNNCYYLMFMDCKSLTTAPEIHAEELATNCCTSMFSRCSSLKIREEIGTTTKPNKIFTCPPGATSLHVSDMFVNTAGSFITGTPTAGNTYYYY